MTIHSMRWNSEFGLCNGTNSVKKIMLLMSLVFFVYIGVAAQDIVVVGQVLSGEDARPLELAHVKFRGTKIGTVTNEQGFFMLRSDVPQKRLEISIVGYKKKVIRLERERDQMLEVFMDEDVNVLDEINLMPGENPAHAILRRVDEMREVNDPEMMRNVGYSKQQKMNINLTDIRQKAKQRRLFRDMAAGMISGSDSMLMLPVMLQNRITEEEIYVDDVYIDTLDVVENSVDILTLEQWETLMGTYCPEVNFYRPYISFLGKAVMSPIARQGRSFYKYYLQDSVLVDGWKHYVISFKPKGGVLPLLEGEMGVDSVSGALTYMDAKLHKGANINFVSSFNVNHVYSPIVWAGMDSVERRNFYYKEKDYALGLSMNIAPAPNKVFWGAMMEERSRYENVRSLGDSVERVAVGSKYIFRPVDSADMSLFNKIDTLKKAKLIRTVKWGVDLIMNQYVHLWKIDVGPVLNLFHYNRLEGASPRLTLRSGERFSKNFTFGGYLGYGFEDDKFKYGGQVQWRFGRERNHMLGAFYDYKVENYGMEDNFIFRENKVEDTDHLFNSPFLIKEYPYAGLRSQIMLRYKYERAGLRVTADAFTRKNYANVFVPFINGETNSLEPYYQQLSLRLGLRFSWRERSLDNFFSRYYLSTDLPVINILAEAGFVEAGESVNPYMKLTFALKHQFAFTLGRFAYHLDASGVLGKIPYTNLIVPRSGRTAYSHKNQFTLVTPFEFVSDIYVGAHLQYETPGLVFGYIPGIKKLGIREVLSFNIGYGAMLQKHKDVFAIPAHAKTFGNMPYMEAGVGFSNILRLLTIESIWRLSYRNTPDAENWQLRFRVDMDF